MLVPTKPTCPECIEPGFDRRDFFRVLGGGAALAVTAGTLPRVLADAPPAKSKVNGPAESLIKELHASLNADQKAKVVLPFDHGEPGKIPTRLGMYNGPVLNRRIGDNYSKAQQELLDRIIRALCSGDDGYRQISRGGTWDNSKSFDQCGALLFGEPGDGKPYAWLFAGHHITLRADGDFKDGVAWGGPMYYGHSPNGYSQTNIFNYQTQSVLKVFDVLEEKQRAKAIVVGTPGEQAPSVKFRKTGEAKPGLAVADLANDQKTLIQEVMRTVLSPYRKEDADEVMAIVKQNGGMDKVHLAFYRDKGADEKERWHFWRLEGPGFVWNYRVLPHVHTYVSIGRPIA